MHKTSFRDHVWLGSAWVFCFDEGEVFFSFEKHRKRESQILTLSLFPVRKLF